MFSKKTLDYVINLVESLIPWLHGNLRYQHLAAASSPAAGSNGKATMRVNLYRTLIENEKAKLHRVEGEVTTKEKTLLSLVWDLVLISMLLYFLVSIIDSSVQQYIGAKDEEEIQKLKKKQEGKAT
jgi:hypothetical protein